MSLSNCSNCYNGCTEIVSDKCVRYTGVDVPVLGIQTGDSLSFVEQALITFLTSTLDGTGIKIDIDPNIICALVQDYLPTCGDLTAVDLFNALIKATCDLQEQIDAIVAELAILNGNYDIDCLTGVTSSSDTHAIVQAVITKLCDVSTDLVALAIDLDTNYVKIADLNDLIQAYLDSIGTSTQYNTRMVPNTAVEYYGVLTNFDVNGVGYANLGFDKIYLCNGQNGTPDKRGRVGVGVTFGSGMDAAVNPGGLNPNYALFTKAGTNSVILSTNQLPSHTHTAVTTISPNPHSHGYVTGTRATNGWSGDNDVDNLGPIGAVTDPVTLSATTTVANTGSNVAHENNQPAIACYYIMYIP
jgi:microcystin-dependent protein